MNEELLSVYPADRQERVNQPKVNTAEYKAMRARDLQHRERVMEPVSKGALHGADDYFHAAHIMNHGDTPEDARNAHRFALRSSGMGYRPARWLAAASYDRWQMYQGKPQKYGTNYVFDGNRDRLWDVDPLAEQLRKAEEANRHRISMSETERKAHEANAPEWLQEALKKWRTQAHPTNNPD